MYENLLYLAPVFILGALLFIKLFILLKFFSELKFFEQRQIARLHDLGKELSDQQINQAERTGKNQLEVLKTLQETLRHHFNDIQQNLRISLDKLSDTTGQSLKEISKQVDTRLLEGFEKTSKTFNDIVTRLALIDDAQKKLSDLSHNVVSLQEILIDKRSRGAFGEVQLKNLIHNMLPIKNYEFQYTLSNGLRADCVLFLPEPIGELVIDSKFPLENYQKFTTFGASEIEKKQALNAFKQDVKKHIEDISDKYVLPNETATGALMFIPAEAIFAEIHHQFPDIITLAHQKQVWLVSPTTMMAVLTIASHVLKDSATKEQIHVIKEHLSLLAKDFSRFEERMIKLAKHIDQAQEDVRLVNTSAKKITQRFHQIERVELSDLQLKSLETTSE